MAVERQQGHRRRVAGGNASGRRPTAAGTPRFPGGRPARRSRTNFIRSERGAYSVGENVHPWSGL